MYIFGAALCEIVEAENVQISNLERCGHYLADIRYLPAILDVFAIADFFYFFFVKRVVAVFCAVSNFDYI